MKREEDQELWDLLGGASSPVVSPFFARNLVRQIRQQRSWRHVVVDLLTGRRAVPAMAMAVVLCTAASVTMIRHHGSGSAQEEIPDVVARVDPSDYEVVADLDNLLASQEDDTWDDTPTL